MSNGPNEAAMIKDIAASAGELLEAGGAKNIHTYADPPRGRWAVHEAGIARMGNDPKKSVLTQFQQTHDVKTCSSWTLRDFRRIRARTRH